MTWWDLVVLFNRLVARTAFLHVLLGCETGGVQIGKVSGDSSIFGADASNGT